MRGLTILLAISMALTACKKTEPTKDIAPVIQADLQDYRIAGNEPFWIFEVTDNQAVFKTPEYLDGITIELTRKEVEGNLQFSGLLNGQPITLILTDIPCENDMSGDMHDMKASYFVDGKTYPGCADRV